MKKSIEATKPYKNIWTVQLIWRTCFLQMDIRTSLCNWDQCETYEVNLLLRIKIERSTQSLCLASLPWLTMLSGPLRPPRIPLASIVYQSVRCDAFLPARTHFAPDNFCPHALRTHACFLPRHTPHPHSHFKIFYIANKILESGRYGIKLSWSADKYAEYIYTLFMWRPKRYDYCFL